MFKILRYSEMERNWVREITEGLFRKYSTLWQHKFESSITVLKILYTLTGGPLEDTGFSLSSLYVNPALWTARNILLDRTSSGYSRRFVTQLWPLERDKNHFVVFGQWYAHCAFKTVYNSCYRMTLAGNGRWWYCVRYRRQNVSSLLFSKLSQWQSKVVVMVVPFLLHFCVVL